MKAKFTPKINEGNNTKKDKDLNVNKPVSISRLPPPIPAKSPKEINEISKYFKKNIEKKTKKLYAQASSSSTNSTREILKIKEVFSNLQNKKIKTFKKSSVIRTSPNQSST